jgi:hypothetical protein
MTGIENYARKAEQQLRAGKILLAHTGRSGEFSSEIAQSRIKIFLFAWINFALESINNLETYFLKPW